jgi:predicted glycosyltransferase
MMRFELIPLLQRARDSRNCLQIVSSIRDILQPKSKPGRNREICELIEACYDRVLVHGDPALATLEDSFTDAHRISHKLAYSGYVCQASAKPATESSHNGDVLVSAGGSDTGLALLEAAIAARPQTRLNHCHWRILVSPAIDEAAFQRLRRQTGPDFSVERNRDDFSNLMRQASLSISQAGYNTVTDILGSRAAAVVVPFAEANEIEQLLRARRLQERGRLIMLESNQLSATSLAAAVDRALDLDTSFTVDLGGAANSATMIENWLEAAAA